MVSALFFIGKNFDNYNKILLPLGHCFTLTNAFMDLILTADQISTLAQAGVIPKGTSPAQVAVFAETCRQHGLSPFKKEIYLVGYGGNYSVIVGIDGLRMKAARTGQLAGCDAPQFNLSADGSYLTAADLDGKMPATCSVTVYRAVGGIRAPFTATVAFNEFCPIKPSNKWMSMPLQMIAKVAEAFALRKGFADALAGLSIEEEGPAIADLNASKALPDGLEDALAKCKTIDDLQVLYNAKPEHAKHMKLFTARKNQIQNGQ